MKICICQDVPLERYVKRLYGRKTLVFSRRTEDHAIQYFLSDKSKNMICYIFHIYCLRQYKLWEISDYELYDPLLTHVCDFFLDFLW